MNAVKKVAAQMNTSYDPDVRRQFRPGDEGWDPTVWLIKKYSKAQIPKDNKPVLIARHVAVLSGKADLDGGKFAEWTAPSTPIYLIYSELPTKDAVHVGTIGDLFVWIEKSENDFRFYVQTLILGVFSLILGVLIWRQQTLASGSLQDYGGKKEPPNMESHRSCDPSVNRGSGSPISTITPLRS